MRDFGKIYGYSRELKYCFSSTADVRSFRRLLFNTAKFHVMNAIAPIRESDGVFSIKIKIDNGCEPTLYLRAYGGDIFVLYEVFADHCYYITDSYLDPNEVAVIIDCGANVGLTSIYFASRYPKAKIISVEPHPANFELLRRNTESEERIVPVNAAIVGQARQTVRFSIDRPSWGNRITEGAVGIEIPAITLSQLFKAHNLLTVDLLKVDVEGAEEEIFSHGEFLPLVDCGIIELHGNYSAKRFDADLSKWGFTPVWPPAVEGVKMTLFRKSAGNAEASAEGVKAGAAN